MLSPDFNKSHKERTYIALAQLIMISMVVWSFEQLLSYYVERGGVAVILILYSLSPAMISLIVAGTHEERRKAGIITLWTMFAIAYVTFSCLLYLVIYK